jgi:hypothetical protein
MEKAKMMYQAAIKQNEAKLAIMKEKVEGQLGQLLSVGG